jgi:hypothetical protein
VLGRILAASLCLVTACYSPPKPDCGFVCRQSGECPSDYFCAPDGICHLEGTPATMQCAIDARVDSPRPIDAPPVDADTTAPALFASAPTNGATNVARTSDVRLEFNEPVFNVSATTFTLSSSSVAIPGTVTAVDPYNHTFSPTSLLPASATITVQLTSAITDGSGNALVATSFSFQTGT